MKSVEIKSLYLNLVKRLYLMGEGWLTGSSTGEKNSLRP